MKKNIVIVGIIVLVGLGFWLLGKKNNPAPSENPVVASSSVSEANVIFFYGTGCPHCEIVEKFMAENSVTDKIQMDQLEVFNNMNNAKLMKEKAKICQLDTGTLGVPMLWDNGKCYVGDQDIINNLKEKIDVK